MIKACELCGKEFESTDRRRKYCGEQCAYQVRVKASGRYQRQQHTADRWAWAKHEAEVLRNMVKVDKVDLLDDYIYNNYNKRKGK